MKKMMTRATLLAITLLSCFSCLASSMQWAPQLWLNGGWGKQSNSSQYNSTLGVDLQLWEYRRSDKQSLAIGMSYTHLATDREHHDKLEAFSVYPQYNLFAEPLGEYQPYFFFRALGISYITQPQLGSRQQANHFAFQAQAGVGLILGRQHPWRISLSYKHFSNGYLFSPNEGIDVPLVLSIGKSF